jgi:hypothetical protein
MTDRFRTVKNDSEPRFTSFAGLKNEVYTTVVRYFAPVVAIYEELEKTAGIPPAWQRKKLNQDRLGKQE